MTPQHVESIMAELAAGDPPDFADLSIGEGEARALMAAHFCELDRNLAESGLEAETRLEIMTAIAAHAMVENMLLNVERFRRADGDVRDWLQRFRIAGSG